MIVGPIVAARMEAQASGSVQSRNAASAQIRFRERADDAAATWRPSRRAASGDPDGAGVRDGSATVAPARDAAG